MIGIGTMLAIAYTAAQIAVLLSPNAAPRYHAAAGLFTFAGVLAYYPLAYWSLMGMETGLFALLVLTGVWAALSYRRTPSQRVASRPLIAPS